MTNFLLWLNFKIQTFLHLNVKLTKLVCVMLVVFGNNDDINTLIEIVKEYADYSPNGSLKIDVAQDNAELKKKLKSFQKALIPEGHAEAKLARKNNQLLFVLFTLVTLVTYFGEAPHPRDC